LFFLGFAISPMWTATMDIAPAYAGSASALMNAAGAVAGILSPLMFGWILDRTASWTTPFIVSLGLLLCGAVLTYWFQPDRLIDAVHSVGGLAAACASAKDGPSAWPTSPRRSAAGGPASAGWSGSVPTSRRIP